MENKIKNFTKLAFVLLALGTCSSYGSFFHDPTIRPVVPRVEKVTNRAAQEIRKLKNRAAQEIRKLKNEFCAHPCKTTLRLFACGLLKDLCYLVPAAIALPHHPRFSRKYINVIRRITIGWGLEKLKKPWANKGMRSFFFGGESDLYAGFSFADRGFELAETAIEKYAHNKSVNKMFEPYRNITPSQEALDIGKPKTIEPISIEDLLPENKLYSLGPENYLSLYKEGDF